MNKTIDQDALTVIGDLMSLADTVMSERQITILNYDDSDENQRLLDLHDRLVVMARDLSEFFAESNVPDETPTRDAGVEDEILHQMPDEWTTDDLAKAAGVNKSTLDRIMSGETARPQAKTLRKIEAALGLEEGHLDVE